MKSKYDDIHITQEIDDHGQRYLLSLNGKRVVANSMREYLRAMSLIHDLPENCKGKTVDVTTARRRARRSRTKRRIAHQVVEPLTSEDYRLQACRFQDLNVEAGSVHLILTDIPYGADFVPELPGLAEFATRVLAEGGLFVTAVGKSYLPDYITEFGKRLQWGWLAVTTFDGDSPRIHRRNCVDRYTGWLIYSKGKWLRRGQWCDRFDSPGKEKDYHPWQKSVADVEHWLRRFSRPGDLVCDPCAGAFTTVVACVRNSRRFVGCDVVAENVVVGQQRLVEALHGR